MLYRKGSSIRRILLLFIWVVLSFNVYAENSVKALIPMPSACYTVDKVVNSKIYLKKIADICTQQIVMKEVTLEQPYRSVDIYTDGKFWKTHILYGETLEQQIDKMQDKVKNIKLPGNVNITPQIQEKAENVFKYTQNKEFQSQVDEFKSDIMKGMQIASPENSSSMFYSQMKPAARSMVPSSDRIYVFISSSMPVETARAYARALSRIGEDNVFLVMRGGIGGLKKIAPTVEWISSVLKKDPLCTGDCEVYRTKVLIDPLLFRKYEIIEVPAVVYVKNVVNTEGLSEGLNSVKVKDAFISYGDISLAYHLKLIAEHSRNEHIKLIAEHLEK